MRRARRESAAADRDQAVLVVAHLDVANADGRTGAQYAPSCAQAGVRSRAQIVDAHVDGRDASSKLRSQAGVSGNVDERRDDAAMVIWHIGRAREFQPMLDAHGQAVFRLVPRDDVRAQPLMKRRPRQQRVDETVVLARATFRHRE